MFIDKFHGNNPIKRSHYKVKSVNYEVVLNVLKIYSDRVREFIFENYTWDKIAAKMVKIYRTILINQDMNQTPLCP